MIMVPDVAEVNQASGWPSEVEWTSPPCRWGIRGTGYCASVYPGGYGLKGCVGGLFIIIMFGSAQWRVGSTGKMCGVSMLFFHVTLMGTPLTASKVAPGALWKRYGVPVELSGSRTIPP